MCGPPMRRAPHNEGGVRAYSDAECTQEIPLHTVYANPAHYRTCSGGAEHYAFLQTPAGFYDASLGASGRVVRIYRDAQRHYVEQYDIATKTWLEPVYVGSAVNDTYASGDPIVVLEPGDDHDNGAIIKDASGVYHVFFGGHNTFWKHSTSNDLVTWTAQANIGVDVSYPAAHRIGDDLIVFFRQHDDRAGDVHGPTVMHVQSDAWASQQITDLKTNYPGAVAGTWQRTYHTWTQKDGSGNIHFLLLLHDVATTQYPEAFYAVFVPTIVGGEVTGWTWQDIAGNTLTTDAPITFTDVNSSPTYLFGPTGSGALIENAFTGSKNAIGNWTRFDLDDNGYPHMLLDVSASADHATADVYYVRWDGASWQSDRVDVWASGNAPLPVAATAPFANTASDVTFLVTENSIGASSVVTRLHWDGASWTRTVVQDLPATDPNYAIIGTAWRSPIKMEGVPESVGFDATVNQVGRDRITNGWILGGPFPTCALGRDGTVLDSRRALFVPRVTVPASGDTTIYLKITDGSLPADNSTYGRDAVWSPDYDAVAMPMTELFWPLDGNASIHDLSGNGNHFGRNGRLQSGVASTDLTDGSDSPMPAWANYVQGIRSVETPNDDTQWPDNWIGRGYTNSAGFVSFVASGAVDWAGESVLLMVGQGNLIYAHNDESSEDDYIYVFMNSGANGVDVRLKKDGGAAVGVLDVAWNEETGAALYLPNLTAGTHRLAVNGTLSASDSVAFPINAALDAHRINEFRQNGANPGSFQTGTLMLFAMGSNKSHTDWEAGRAVIETAAWQQLADAAFVSAVEQ